MHMQQNIDRKQNYAHNTRPYPTTTWWSRYRELVRGQILTNATTLIWILTPQNHLEEVNSSSTVGMSLA